MSRRTSAQVTAERIAADVTGMPPGEFLPTWEQLATRYDIGSRATVAKALGILTARGIVEHVPGFGHRRPLSAPSPIATIRRASSDQTQVIDGWRGWHAVCRAAGREPFTDSVPRETPLPSHAAPWLGVTAGTPVIERGRVQGWLLPGGRQPVVLSWTWLHPGTVRELPVLALPNTGPGGLTSRLEDAGHRPWWEETVRARRVDAVEAGRLEMTSGAPVLDVWRRCWDGDGDRVLEVTRRVINPELHELVFRYP